MSVDKVGLLCISERLVFTAFLKNDKTHYNEKIIAESGSAASQLNEISEATKGIKDSLKELYEDTEIEEDHKKKQGEYKKLSIVSVGLSIIGFLLFFCILVFPPVMMIFQERQSIYTVIAFAVMLSSQYFESFRNERDAVYKEKADKHCQEFEQRRNQLIEIKDAVKAALR